MDTNLAAPSIGVSQGPETATKSARVRALQIVQHVAFAIAAPAALVGFAMDDVLALTCSAALMGVGFMARDLARWRRESISPMTLFAFGGTLTAIANTLAVLNQDTWRRPQYFMYAVDAHLPLALKIDWMGLVLPILAFSLMRSSTGRALSSFAPRVYGTLSDSRLVPVAFGCAAFGILSNTTDFLPSLGTLTGFVSLLPHLAAFALAQRGVAHRKPRFVWLGLFIASVEAVRALLTAYLRSNIVSPLFAYAIGVFIGERSLRAARSVYILPLYPVAIAFVVYFTAFGDVRSRSSGGLQRLEAVHQEAFGETGAEEPPRPNVFSRISSINQLTQVCRVVQEDGFLGGQTLEYMAYAWIPRFLWPEKPVIAKGAWFALRIGQARIYRGRITNSVNMTVRGELFLNFGWTGVILGSLLFGAFFAVLWSAAGALRDIKNVLGAAFAMYLLWVGRGGGADLQIVVTLVAVYLLFVGATIALTTLGQNSAHSTTARSSPRRELC